MTLYYTDNKTMFIFLKQGEATRWISLYDLADFKCVFLVLFQTTESNVRQFEHFGTWVVVVQYKFCTKSVKCRRDIRIDDFHQIQE